jgi:hypothetical protein
MKKFIIIIVLTALYTTNGHAQVSMGIHASGIAADGRLDESWKSSYDDPRPSWKAGLLVNIPLSKRISLMPQMNVVNKGGKIDRSEETSGPVSYSVMTKGENTLTYLEIPLYVNYNMRRFWIGAGPSVSIGLHGRSNATVTTRFSGRELIREDSRRIKFDGRENPPVASRLIHARTLEYGANVMVGYRFARNFFASAGCNISLTDIIPDADTDWKNNYVGVGIGYFFHRK